LAVDRDVANHRIRSVPPARAPGGSNRSKSTRDRRLVSRSVPQQPASAPSGRPVPRGNRNGFSARNQAREQNAVVLALARLVREATDAEEADNAEESAPPRRITDTTHQNWVVLRLSDASGTAA
jgi:hypothetical protein